MPRAFINRCAWRARVSLNDRELISNDLFPPNQLDSSMHFKSLGGNKFIIPIFEQLPCNNPLSFVSSPGNKSCFRLHIYREGRQVFTVHLKESAVVRHDASDYFELEPRHFNQPDGASVIARIQSAVVWGTTSASTNEFVLIPDARPALPRERPQLRRRSILRAALFYDVL